MREDLLLLLNAKRCNERSLGIMELFQPQTETILIERKFSDITTDMKAVILKNVWPRLDV
jgi:hypothetical protein